jgi:hypothetical protein
MKKYSGKDVEEYIEKCPKEAQDKLRKIRAAIWEVAPDSAERTDYFQIPGYSYEGYDYDGMFAWFSFKKPNVRLHVRPPVLQEHKIILRYISLPHVQENYWTSLRSIKPQNRLFIFLWTNHFLLSLLARSYGKL